VQAADRSRQRLANLLVRSLSEEVPRDVLDAARAEREAAERLLAEASAEARAELEGPSLGATDVLAALPAGSALVSFVRYDRGALSPKSTAAPSYAAFVARAGDASVALVSLGPAAPLEEAIRTWRDSVRRPTPGSTAWSARRLVWDPVEPHVGGAKRVFIVPDGSLGLVNFAALAGPGGRYLIETGPTIHYVTTERDLLRPLGPRPAEGLLAVGGPSFGPASSVSPDAAVRRQGACDSSGLRFPPLPGSLGEAQEIARLWNSARRGPAVLVSGAGATEAAVKQSAKGRRVVHLATHGFFVGTDCDPSPAASTRAVGGLVSTFAGGATGPTSNPLLLSGLALSGANGAKASAESDDGILTAEEVAGMDLAGTEWAVLSACDTGVGEVRTGEGVMGLRRAFHIAGARTVIMSLWSVEDASTREWMRALYEGRLRRGLDTPNAVREASLSVLRARRARGQDTHPFYWAAFVAAGDWR
jgi:CHAT domain-containing protein